MDHLIRTTTLALLGALFLVGIYHRIRASKTNEPIDRSQEGWALLLGIRLTALACFVQLYRLFSNPQPPVLGDAFRGLGVIVVAAATAWLAWMFVSLGTNLTDTVVTRKAAHFVDWGPYRYVRNPMYTGLLALGVGLGLVLSDWTITLGFSVIFTLMAIRTRREEAFLLAKFGGQYRAYMDRVGRFFPAL